MLENKTKTKELSMMHNLQTLIENYLEYCGAQKRLDEKTLKAYRIDLKQFSEWTSVPDITKITSETLENHIGNLHTKYKPKTVKRKIASLKAFFHYLEYKELIDRNPFSKIQVRFREPVILPKTIPLHTVETFLTYSEAKLEELSEKNQQLKMELPRKEEVKKQA